MLSSNFNILQRFVIIVGFITLIITVGVSILGYRATLEQMETQLELQLKQDVRTFSLSFKNLLTNLESSLADFALNSLVANALVDDMGRETYTDELFAGLKRVSGVDIQISLVNYRGEVIAGEAFPSDIVDSLTPSIKAAIEHNSYPFWGISTPRGDELILQAPIIFANTGLPEGALIYRFLAEDLFNVILGQDSEENYFGFVRSFFLDFEDKSSGLKGQLIKSKTQLAGVPDIKTSVTLPVTNTYLSLTVGLNADRAQFSNGYKKLLQSKIIFGISIFIFSLLIAYPLGNLLLRRLTSMQIQASNMIESKEFGERFTIAGKDEISLLAAAFNNVLDRLEFAYNQMGLATEQLLKEQAAKYQAVISQSTNAMLLWNPDNKLVEVNKMAEKLIGKSINEIKKMNPSEIIANPTAILEGNKNENLVKGHLNALISVEISKTTLLIGDKPHSLWIITDIREQIAAQKLREEQHNYFEKIAHSDPLTGLPNRRMLNDQLLKSISKAERNNGRLAVCYMDLDGFKEVNDTVGHEGGDQVLIEVAKRLSKIVRPSDMVARLGGDEFVLLLTEFESDAQCLTILERVLESLRDPHHLQDKLFNVSASIGVTLYPNDDDEPETLLRHADQAMYLAKQKGRNQFHLFNKEKDFEAQNRQKVLEEFKAALEHNQLILEYQPKVDMGTGDVVGAEALIRWLHPERGLLMPGEFLPYLEGNSQTENLDWHVISQALKQLNEWVSKNLTLELSVNISATTIQSLSFIETFLAELSQYPHLPKDRLVLEIIESEAILDLQQVAEVVKHLRKIGVQVSLDDFGTGYSSLSYFRQLPVNELKIDASFIRDILQDSSDLDLVRGIIGLAQTFGKRIVAEGVETIEHGTLLLRLGCQIAQGYVIARAMSSSEFETWLSNYQAPPIWLECGALGAWPEEDMPLLLAESDQTSWVNQLTQILHGEIDQDEFEINEHNCRFGHWFENDGLKRYSKMQSFEQLNELYHQTHQLGNKLLVKLILP
jgi:diguanylate cyclase (GGDEF)-like protein